MRLLIAPDKFKGTFTAAQICDLLSRGIREEKPHWQIDAQPLADGGEGTMDAILGAVGGACVPSTTRGPMGVPHEASWGLTHEGTAVFESAVFLGLHLVPPAQRSPLRASSRGLGEAIAAALESGVRRFLVGLGGVATVDGGLGMAAALGYRLEDAGGRPLEGCARDLDALANVDASMAHPALAQARFTALCDVSHPLIGPQGAARVFGPQKGATPDEVSRLDEGLRRLARILAGWKGVPPEVLTSMPMGGAAGGLGVGTASFLNASLEPGAIFLMRLLLSPGRLEGADLVVTGEGSLDEQTSGGKVAAAILGRAALGGRPVVVVTGRWDGTLPAPRPAVVEVLGPGMGKEGLLETADLVEVGRELARRAEGLAKRAAG
ncbi:MAG: glycerate kinase family protein [Candidatus Polarisedimenticolia bacterium]